MANQVPKRGRGRPPKASADPIPSRFAPPEVNIPNDNQPDDMELIMQQIYDSEIAMAMDASLASDMQNELYQNENNDIVGRGRGRAQAEEPEPEPAHEHFQDDDIDAVMEQIRQLEAQEILKKKGNAYDKPINIDGIIDNLDKEDEELRLNAEKQIKYSNWQSEKDLQDWEYEQALLEQQRIDEAKQQQIIDEQNAILSKQKELTSAVQSPTELTPTEQALQADCMDVPKSREEMRLARLKFFNKPRN